jgi:hypothetical protein
MAQHETPPPPFDPGGIHDIRHPISGELWGVVIERDRQWNAYDQTEAYIDSFASFDDAKRAVEAAYGPPPPTPR